MSLIQNPNVYGVADAYTSMVEGRGGLSGKSLVNNLTDICLSHWFQMSAKFTSDPDRMDIHDDQTHDKFKLIKMSPGADVRDAVYKELINTSQTIADKLNKAFDSEVFEARMSRQGGSLEILVGFVKHNGGVFQVKAEASGAGSIINLTMPNERELIRAFSKMTDTPHPDDVEDGIEGDGDTDVGDIAGETVPEFDGENAADRADVDSFEDIPDDGEDPQDGSTGLDDEDEDDVDSQIKLKGESYLYEGKWKILDAAGKTIGRLVGSAKSVARKAKELFGTDRPFTIEGDDDVIISGNPDLDESFLGETTEYTDADRKDIMKAITGFWSDVETYIKDARFINETFSESGEARVYLLEFTDSEHRLRAVTRLDQMGQNVDDKLDDVLGEFGRSEYESNFSSSGNQFEGELRASLGILDSDGLVEKYYVMKSLSARKIRVAIYKQPALQLMVKTQTARPFVPPAEDRIEDADETFDLDFPTEPLGTSMTGLAADDITRMREAKVEINKVQPKDEEGDDIDPEEDEEDLDEEAVSVGGGGIALPSDAVRTRKTLVTRSGRKRRKKKIKKCYHESSNLFRDVSHYEDGVYSAARAMQEQAVKRFTVQYPDERDGHTKSTSFGSENEMRRFMQNTKGAIEITPDED